MKICFIEPGLHVCGGIRRILEVSNRLCKLGHDVSIYTPNGRSPTWIPCTARVQKLSKVHRSKFDVSVFNLADQYQQAWDVQATKKVFWVLAPEAEYKAPKIPIAALRSGFYMLSNSKFTSRYIKKYCPDITYEPPIIQGGINKNHFRYDPNIPTYFHVLYYGSWRPWKGAALIEQALTGMNLKVLRMEGLNTPQDKMYTLYNRCELYVSANQSEGFSFGQLEAMASGCVVITTDDGGSRDYIKNGKNAVVIPRTASDIRKAINDLLADKPRRRKLRANGILTAAENKYNWDVVTKKFETIIHNLLEHKEVTQA